jgi:hypothetical protein
VTYIYFGRSKYEKTIDLTAGADVTIEGANGTDWAGFAVAAGDVNGDGIADIVIGAPQADSVLPGKKQNDSGITYVVFGRKSFAERRIALAKKGADVEFHSTMNGEYSGSALAVGDFNGDGTADILIGAPFTDKPLNDAGVVYVACGSKDLAGVKDLSKDACTSVRGQNAGDRVGLGVAAGDVNGDGISDIVMGGLETDSGTISNTGDVTVIFGRKNLPPQFDQREHAGFRFWGSYGGDYVGVSLATADVNGDGVADLVVGIPYADLKGGEAEGEEDKKDSKKEADAGKVAVFFGGKGLTGERKLAEGADLMIYGAQGGANYGDHAGGTLGAGDVNGDGIADLLIGASLADVRGRTRTDPEQMKDVGAVFVCYGGKALPKTISLESKFDAVIFGAYKNDMFAGVALTKPRRGDTIFSPSTYRKAWMTRRYDRFFSKALAAGDINGDGVADMILGAPAGDGPRGQGQKIDDAGVVYVVFGKKQA